MNRVVVFAHPEPALSPLSPALPAAFADTLDAAMRADALAAAAGCTAEERTLAWAGANAADAAPAGFRSVTQGPGWPAEWLARTFAAALPALGDRAIVVGSNCPGMSAAHLDEAYAALATHDLAIGQASERGWWLVALSRPAGRLFDELPWDETQDSHDVLDRATALGMSVALLPVLTRVRTPADLARFVGECAGADAYRPPCGTHTQAALRTMGLLP